MFLSALKPFIDTSSLIAENEAFEQSAVNTRRKIYFALIEIE